MQEPLISFARRRDGSIAAIADVVSGLACECTCLACKQPLVARKGPQRKWSFAHYSYTAGACEWSAETALHHAMKALIDEEKRLYIPEFIVRVERKTSYGEPVIRTMSFPGQTVLLDCVALEYSVHPIRPDVVAMAEGQRLFVEVVVANGIDDHKRARIEEIGASAIKIDLCQHNRTVDRDKLRELLLNPASEKSWIFHRRQRELESNLLREIELEISEKEKHHAEEMARLDGIFNRNLAPDSERREASIQQRKRAISPNNPTHHFRLRGGGEVKIKYVEETLSLMVIEVVGRNGVAFSLPHNIGAVATADGTRWTFAESDLDQVIPYLKRVGIPVSNYIADDYRAAKNGW